MNYQHLTSEFGNPSELFELTFKVFESEALRDYRITGRIDTINYTLSSRFLTSPQVAHMLTGNLETWGGSPNELSGIGFNLYPSGEEFLRFMGSKNRDNTIQPFILQKDHKDGKDYLEITNGNQWITEAKGPLATDNAISIGKWDDYLSYSIGREVLDGFKRRS